MCKRTLHILSDIGVRSNKAPDETSLNFPLSDITEIVIVFKIEKRIFNYFPRVSVAHLLSKSLTLMVFLFFRSDRQFDIDFQLFNTCHIVFL